MPSRDDLPQTSTSKPTLQLSPRPPQHSQTLLPRPRIALPAEPKDFDRHKPRAVASCGLKGKQEYTDRDRGETRRTVGPPSLQAGRPAGSALGVSSSSQRVRASGARVCRHVPRSTLHGPRGRGVEMRGDVQYCNTYSTFCAVTRREAGSRSRSRSTVLCGAGAVRTMPGQRLERVLAPCCGLGSAELD